MASLTVTQLNIYPVKSCRGIGLTTMAIGEWGPEWDRRLMLTDDNGSFLTARKHPQLLSVVVALGIGELVLSAPGNSTIRLRPEALEEAQQRVDSTIWRDQVEACIVSDEASLWFSEILGIPVQLVYMPESAFRQVDRQYFERKQRVGFADGFPFLMTHQSSLDELSQRINKSLSMRRFRPNIVVDGGVPWQEDGWSKIKIGQLSFAVVKPCSRCVMTTIEPDTLARSTEPLKTLSGYRKTDSGVIFGQNLVHLDRGIIQVGDQVEILQ